jgi:TRAP-type C4-dicarboxylate transport system permease small subunit
MTSVATSVLKRLERLNAAIAVILFAALTIVVALQVFTRFVLHLPFIWSEEVARFLFFWVVLLGAATGVRRRRHFVIDITAGHTESWGRKGRLLFDVTPQLCILAFALFLFVQGIGYAQTGLLRSAPNSGISMSLVYGAIPVFAALSAIYAAVGLICDIAAFRQGRSAQTLRPGGAE